MERQIKLETWKFLYDIPGERKDASFEMEETRDHLNGIKAQLARRRYENIRTIKLGERFLK